MSPPWNSTRAPCAPSRPWRETEGRLTIIEADALRQDLTRLVPAPRAVVANLPYNVGTPLLVSWLAQAGAFSAFTLMFQLEVAERICAAPDTDAYGRLAVLAQWLCETAIVMHIPAAAFAPPPKVDSACIRLIPGRFSRSVASFGRWRQSPPPPSGNGAKCCAGP